MLEQRSAPVSPADFLQQASKRSLGVVAFTTAPKHGENDVAQALREEYSKLFEHFPDTTSQKFAPGHLDTESGRAHALVQLATNLHRGEVAELDPELTRWRLVAKAQGSASALRAHSQFFCIQGGSPVRRPPEQCYEFGRPLPQAVWVAPEHSDYEPDWSHQCHRGRLMVLSFESGSRSGRRPIVVSGVSVLGGIGLVGSRSGVRSRSGRGLIGSP